MWWSAVLVVGHLVLGAPPPHIIHIVGDDVGFNDPGFMNGGVYHTPHMDELAHNGVQLHRYYTFKMCSPSRTSIMSGRYTFHYGYYDNADASGPTGGLAPNFTIVAKDMKTAGYATHAIGKWHCGFRTEKQVATFKGFDSFLGYYHAEEEYFTHMFGGETSPVAAHCGNHTCCGVDLSAASAPNQIAPATGYAGVYSTDMYTERAVDIINHHDPSTPLYIYLAYQNVHGPLQSTSRYQRLYNSSWNKQRAKQGACLSAMDEGIANVTAALKKKGMWGNTVLAWHSDNGGPAPSSNNYPLRGGKFTLWDGGVRAIGFVHSELIPQNRRGTTWDGLVHSSDWRPTWAALAGVQPQITEEEGPIDGINVWDALVAGEPSPRKEIVHQVLNQWNGQTCDRHQEPYNSKHPAAGAALMSGHYKLVVGYPQFPDVIYPLFWNKSVPVPPSTNCSSPKVPCAGTCLFDVFADPGENHNIADEHPDIVKTMRDRLDAVSATGIPRVWSRLTPEGHKAMCDKVHSSGYWQPWQH